MDHKVTGCIAGRTPSGSSEMEERYTVANEIVTRAERLAYYAESLVDETNGRLAPIVPPEKVVNIGHDAALSNKLDSPVAARAPLFAALDAQLDRIEYSLQALDSTIGRTQV